MVDVPTAYNGGDIKCWWRVAMLASVVLTFTVCSCSVHEYPEDIEVAYTELYLEVDWSKFTQDETTGMTVIFYPEDGSIPTKFITNSINGTTVKLRPGCYTAVVHNQTSGEFSSLSFMDFDDYSKARITVNEAVARNRLRSGTSYIEPEWIAFDKLSGIQVGSSKGKSQAVVKLTPECVVTTMHIEIALSGIKNLGSVSANVSGLAAGHQLKSGRQTADKVNHAKENWSLKADDSNPTKGILVIEYQTFGLSTSDDSSGFSRDVDLSLSILLVDGSTVINREYNLSELLNADEYGKNITVKISDEIVLPDVVARGSSSGGGMNVSVDGWGSETVFKVKM